MIYDTPNMDDLLSQSEVNLHKSELFALLKTLFNDRGFHLSYHGV